jgi:uncharacterized phage infection (PIP) family protein YhgE
MATNKKHIAVYLDPAIEQALITFCEKKGLKSKKGTMFSAGVNAALSEFFGISDIGESNTPDEVDNTPQKVSNILPNSSNIPASADDTILPSVSNTPAISLVVDVMPGKRHLSESEAGSLRQELEEVKADRAELLESSTHITNKLRQEVRELRSQLETERADREQVEAKLAELQEDSATASKDLPEAADLLNQLKAKRKKSTASLADIEVVLEIIEKFCDGTSKELQE